MLLLLYLTATLVQLFFWTFFFSRLAFYRYPERREEAARPVSVVICARDEAANLKKNLGHFLNQNYRLYEVIVVNDNSSDRTGEVLLEFQAKKRNLRVINLTRPTLPGKKSALTIGIEACRHDRIVVSDADCAPAGPQWLQRMQSPLRDPVEVVLGYSPYRRRPGWLNRFIRFEAVYTAVQYLSFALAGIPYMGVGRNLAYSRRLWRRHGGFERHSDVISGDDDLFVNAAAHKGNTTIVIERGAFVFSEPKSTWRGYYFQKRRHLTTGKRYRPLHQALLGLLAASHAGHYLAGLALLFSGRWLTLVFLIYLVRIGVVSSLYYRILDKLDDTALRPWTPLLDAAITLYYFLFAPVLLTGPLKQWK